MAHSSCVESESDGGVTQTFTSSYKLPLPGGFVCPVSFANGTGSSSLLTPHLFLAFSKHLNATNEGHLVSYEEETYEATLLSRMVLDVPVAAAAVLSLEETEGHACTAMALAADAPSSSLCLFRSVSPLTETDSSSSNGGGGKVSLIQTLLPPVPFAQIHAVLPSTESSGELCAADSEKCVLFLKHDSGYEASRMIQVQQTACEAAAWDPHDSRLLLTAHSNSGVPFLRRTGGSSGGCLSLWDVRQSSAASSVHTPEAFNITNPTFSCSAAGSTENPHSTLAAPTAVCFNANIPFCFLSGGTDGAIRCWDRRKLATPVKVLRDVQSHWIAHAVLNPFHDQLLLTAGPNPQILNNSTLNH